MAFGDVSDTKHSPFVITSAVPEETARNDSVEPPSSTAVASSTDELLDEGVGYSDVSVMWTSTSLPTATVTCTGGTASSPAHPPASSIDPPLIR